MSLYTRAVIAALVVLVSVNQLFGMVRTKKFVLDESFFKTVETKDQCKTYNYNLMAQEFVIRLESGVPGLEIYCDYLMIEEQARLAVLCCAINANASTVSIVWIVEHLLIPYEDFYLIGRLLIWAIMQGNENVVKVLCTQYSECFSDADLRQFFESLSILARQNEYLANRFYGYLVRARQCNKIERALSSIHSGMASPKALIP